MSATLPPPRTTTSPPPSPPTCRRSPPRDRLRRSLRRRPRATDTPCRPTRSSFPPGRANSSAVARVICPIPLMRSPPSPRAASPLRRSPTDLTLSPTMTSSTTTGRSIPSEATTAGRAPRVSTPSTPFPPATAAAAGLMADSLARPDLPVLDCHSVDRVRDLRHRHRLVAQALVLVLADPHLQGVIAMVTPRVILDYTGADLLLVPLLVLVESDLDLQVPAVRSRMCLIVTMEVAGPTVELLALLDQNGPSADQLQDHPFLLPLEVDLGDQILVDQALVDPSLVPTLASADPLLEEDLAVPLPLNSAGTGPSLLPLVPRDRPSAGPPVVQAEAGPASAHPRAGLGSEDAPAADQAEAGPASAHLRADLGSLPSQPSVLSCPAEVGSRAGSAAAPEARRRAFRPAESPPSRDRTTSSPPSWASSTPARGPTSSATTGTSSAPAGSAPSTTRSAPRCATGPASSGTRRSATSFTSVTTTSGSTGTRCTCSPAPSCSASTPTSPPATTRSRGRRPSAAAGRATRAEESG